jgi:surfactin synthase thioesterase subunit
MTAARHLRAGSRWQLVCLPWAGGTAYAYGALAGAMPEGWEVIAIDAPGHGGRRGPLLADFDQLAAEFAAQVRQVATPAYALFGHSLGGLVAYRVARGLAASPLAPQALVLSACTPPEASVRREPASVATRAGLARFLTDAGATHPDLIAHPEFLDYLAPVLQADLRAAATFSEPDDSPLALPALLLAGTRDEQASAPAVARWQSRLPRATVREIEGGHMVVIGNAAVVARALHDLADVIVRGSAPRSS